MRFERAWLEAAEMRDGVLDDGQQALLLQLAYHAAAGNLCDGLVLDDARFATAFEQLRHGDHATMSDEERRYFERHLLVQYGVAVGLFLGEASQRPDAFCADARQHRNGGAAGDSVHYWR